MWDALDFTKQSTPMVQGVTQNADLTQALLKGQGYVKEPIRMPPVVVTPSPKEASAAGGVVLPLAVGAALLLFTL